MPTSQQDLNEKLKFEAKFRPVIQQYHKRIVRDYVRLYGNQGDILNFSTFDDELEQILNGHYLDVSNTFRNRITPELPDDVAKTDDEGTLIEEVLAAYFLLQSNKNAREINETTQDQAAQSIEEARNDPLVLEETGRDAQIVASTLAGAFLYRKLSARQESIIVTETQLAAETAKATEAEVLTGLTPSIQSGTTQKKTVKKRWDSVGDSRVRDAHLSADGQIRDISEPFNVGGELLRWPRDDSLGATIGNIINCRCNAKYDTDDIINARR